MLEIQKVPDRRKWEKEKSLCSRCDRLVTNKSYFSGSHVRGTCRPRWKVEREAFEWERDNRRPRRADWRWEDPIERSLRSSSGRQVPLFEDLPRRKQPPEDSNPN